MPHALCLVSWRCCQWRSRLSSLLSHLGLTLFSITQGHSSGRDATQALWSALKCPSQGQSLHQVQLNIDANNAGTVLPLRGDGAGVARSVERDAVWWIGFSRSSRVQNPASCRRAGFSAAKSCYRIRPCSVLSAPSTYRNIFSQIDGENQGREEEESNTLVLSDALGWSLLRELRLMLALHFRSSLLWQSTKCI